jgi:CysZ protein
MPSEEHAAAEADTSVADDDAGPAPAHPGLARRVAAGAWNVPAGFVFLARRPRLWPLAALPAGLAAVLLLTGLGVGLYFGPAIEEAMMRRFGTLPEWLSFPMALAAWAGAAGAGVLVGLGLALLLAAPVLDRLSRRVEQIATGRAEDAGGGLGWEVVQSMRFALYFLARAPGMLLVGLVPMVGPLLSGVWAAHALSVQSTDPALARSGLDFAARRAWHRRFRAESLGLGLASLVTLLVPCAGFLLAPALVTGGTLLVAELTPSLPGPPPSP